MGRNLSPLFRRELANLDKDDGSRRSAIKALKSYVKDLDSKAIPHFLAEVSETKAPGSSPGECTISLYEVLARVHGRKIVPQIDNIMTTIMRTLSSSAGSFPLHQACSRVVPAVARYAIDPSTPGDEKIRIICSLCKPLSDVLMDLHESTASGAALCLSALVEADNWRFAPDDMVNEVCLKVAGAMEVRVTQTNYHMGLVMALAKHNSLISEAYARSFLRSGLQVLTAGCADSNSQKRLSSIQMINSLMKYIDLRSISSELFRVADAMEKCQSDQMEFIRRAAFETLQATKIITSQKGSKQGIYLNPSMGSSFYRRDDNSSNDVADEVDRLNDSPDEFPSPESQTIDSFIRYDNFTDSPTSIEQPSVNFEYARRSNMRLWDNDITSVDVSLKDGLFVKACSGSDDFGLGSEQLISELNGKRNEHSEVFTGFVKNSAMSMTSRSATPSPQKSRSQLTLDDIKIYSTPRKLIRSLQNPASTNSQVPESRNPASAEVEQPVELLNGDILSHNLNCKAKGMTNAKNMKSQGNQKKAKDDELVIDGTESVSSTDDTNGDSTCRTLCRDGCEDKNEVPVKSLVRAMSGKGVVGFITGVFLVLLAILLSTMRTENNDLYFEVVPT